MKRLLFLLLLLALPFSSFAEKPHWLRTKIVDLSGNTGGAFTAVSLPSDCMMAIVKVRQNPGGAWQDSCTLQASLVSLPNTYTANYGFTTIAPSSANTYNSFTHYYNQWQAHTLYLNLTSVAKALIEIEQYYLYLK